MGSWTVVYGLYEFWVNDGTASDDTFKGDKITHEGCIETAWRYTSFSKGAVETNAIGIELSRVVLEVLTVCGDDFVHGFFEEGDMFNGVEKGLVGEVGVVGTEGVEGDYETFGGGVVVQSLGVW